MGRAPCSAWLERQSHQCMVSSQFWACVLGTASPDCKEMRRLRQQGNPCMRKLCRFVKRVTVECARWPKGWGASPPAPLCTSRKVQLWHPWHPNWVGPFLSAFPLVTLHLVSEQVPGSRPVIVVALHLAWCLYSPAVRSLHLVQAPGKSPPPY